MIIAIWAGGALIVLGLAGMACWAVAAERGAAEWRAADRDWRRSGADVLTALSAEVLQRARRSRRNSPAARPRGRHGHDRDPGKATIRRTGTGPQRGSQGRAEGMP